MRIRSRYARHFPVTELDDRSQAGILAGTLSSDDHLRDIANERKGRVIVSCWPQAEGSDNGRKWGMYGTTSAVVMPFQCQARSESEMVRLDTFTLELLLCERVDLPVPHERCIQSAIECSHHQIFLVTLPSPRMIPQPVIDLSQQEPPRHQRWRFSSKETADCDGRSRGAKWEWHANGSDCPLLHGGMAVRHTGESFFLACRVRGVASLPISYNLRLRYRFSNHSELPKWWRVVPQDPNDDFRQSLVQLEERIQSLNRYSSTPVQIQPGGQASQTQGHNFSGPSIGGQANVIMGSAFFGHIPYGPLPGGGDVHGGVAQHPGYSMSYSMGQMMG